MGNRLAALERISELVRELSDATVRAMSSHSNPSEGAIAMTRMTAARARLAEAITASPVPLPECQAVAESGATYGTDKAEAELEGAMAKYRTSAQARIAAGLPVDG
jgi:hypothetical protein